MRSLRFLILTLSVCAAEAVAADCVGWAGFQTPVKYSSSARQVVLVRDLDGDGAPEIIASGNQVDELGAFSLFANRGDGTFTAERFVVSQFGERLEDIGDLNGDGVPDLVVSNYWSNGIAIYRGAGALRFDQGTPYGTATHGGPSLIADFDHDGTPDVISLSFGSGNPVRLHLFHGNGDGTLAPKDSFDTQLANGDSPSTRTVNGALEILVSEHAGNLGLLHYSNGSLSVSRISGGPGIDRSSIFADVDGDGIADIVDVDDVVSANEPVFITLANADGTFRERKQLARPRKVVFPIKVRVADFDGDGRADLIVCDFRATNLFFFRGDGAGDFSEGIAVDAGAPVNSFDIADVNRDGRLDIVTANNDQTVSVLLNRGPCQIHRRAAKHGR